MSLQITWVNFSVSPCISVWPYSHSAILISFPLIKTWANQGPHCSWQQNWLIRDCTTLNNAYKIVMDAPRGASIIILAITNMAKNGIFKIDSVTIIKQEQHFVLVELLRRKCVFTIFMLGFGKNLEKTSWQTVVLTGLYNLHTRTQGMETVAHFWKDNTYWSNTFKWMHV